MGEDKPPKLLALAREIASASANFQAALGPGLGNQATEKFMRQLREHALAAFGVDSSERKICGETSLSVDFYFPDEDSIAEVAMGLPNPASEFEKDALKGLMAQDCGCDVRRLISISRPGAVKKCGQPGRQAVTERAWMKHRLMVEIHDLEGEPRRRARHSRAKGRSQKGVNFISHFR